MCSGGEAQHGCIEAVAASGLADIREGLALESAIFARLLQSEQSKARRYFFFRCVGVFLGVWLCTVADKHTPAIQPTPRPDQPPPHGPASA